MFLRDRENRIYVGIGMIFAVLSLFLFIPWLKTQNETFTSVTLWASLDALVLFFAATMIAAKKVMQDLQTKTIPTQDTEAENVKGSIKPFWIIVAAFIVWGVFVLLLCGFARQQFRGNGGLWTNTENLMRSLDSNQYLYMVEHWYTNSGDLATDVSIVFLPGYIILVKPFYYLIRDSFIAGTIVSVICYGLAAGFLYLLVKLDNVTENARKALLYFAVIPGVFFYVAPMSESLFLLTIFASVYFVRKKKWTIAALFGCYAAFTRSSGVFIVIVFVYELALEFWHGSHTWKRFTAFLKKLANVLIIPLGLIAYLVINYVVTGDPLKFMYYQKTQWGQRLGYFFNTIHYMTSCFIDYIKNDNTNIAFALWGMGILAFFSLLLLFVFRGRRLRTSYIIYSLVYFAFSMGTTWLLSAPRYAIGLFTLPMLLSETTEKKSSFIFSILRIAALSLVYGMMFIYDWQVW